MKKKSKTIEKDKVHGKVLMQVENRAEKVEKFPVMAHLSTSNIKKHPDHLNKKR